MTGWAALALVACGDGAQYYIVEGTVVEVHAPDEVVLDHEAIAGLNMPAMVMPFDVADPALLDGLRPGALVVGRYRVAQDGSELVRLRVTGQGVAPAVDEGPAPVRAGQRMPEVRLAAHNGGEVVLGAADGPRTALTFVYTRCPKPEFCPAIVGRLAALDQALGAAATEVQIVAVTLDPAYDTPEVLTAYASQVGASERWRFARAADLEALEALAMSAGLPVLREVPGSPGEIAHGVRVLVVDRDGTLIERYDDTRFPLDRVVQQLTTGVPAGDPSMSGTLTPELP